MCAADLPCIPNLVHFYDGHGLLASLAHQNKGLLNRARSMKLISFQSCLISNLGLQQMRSFNAEMMEEIWQAKVDVTA